jgi:hypothetical protein
MAAKPPNKIKCCPKSSFIASEVVLQPQVLVLPQENRLVSTVAHQLHNYVWKNSAGTNPLVHL